MKKYIGNVWQYVSRIGLKETEDVILFREVIFLNRLLVIMAGVMVIYIPVEIHFYGITMIPMILVLIGLLLTTLIFHHIRLFKFARYYIYTISILFIMIMGLMVGKKVANYVVLIPIVLVATILFKTKAEKIIVFLATLCIYFVQQHLFQIIPPQIYIPVEIQNTFSVIFFVLAFLLTFLIGFYFLGINKEYEDIITQQKERIESKNKEITDSITYARRIQAAILPPETEIKKYFKESFILYKSKDIVAGDFYWWEPAGDIFLFAAADCTGHGVPGAMVSVVCNNALNRSVREFGLTEPGKILDKCRELVIEQFEKSEEDVKDGMDISICAFYTKTNTIQWAGANNPLWMIQNNELKEIKPDKQPIGKHFVSAPFTTHHIQVQKNDLIYIFTDGYADQFGGIKGKKFKTSKMKELLLSISVKSMEDQKSIINETFENWKANLEQVDDVCIIGIKFN